MSKPFRDYTPFHVKSSKDLGEAWRQTLEQIRLPILYVISFADIIPAHDPITPGTYTRGALRTYLIHFGLLFLFGVVSAHCAAERQPLDTMHQRAYSE